MADVTTPVLGLVKQTIGGNRNSWGGILNACMDLLEGAIYGMTSRVFVGGSYTLTNGERRKRILSFTGLLTADQTIVVPNLVGRWTVRNITTGAYKLYFKTADGNPVSVPQGGYSDVWCDGSDNILVGLSTRLRDNQLTAPDGATDAPGFAFASETTLGIRRSGYTAGALINPFTTTNASTTVTVAHNAHGLAVSNPVFYSGASAVGGITIDGAYRVASVVGPNSYTVVHSSQATSGATGGGNVTYRYMLSSDSGGGESVVANGADVAHFSPFGMVLLGRLYALAEILVAGAVKITGSISAAGASFTGAITGTAATFSGLLTLSSTSHMSMAGGTTAQRPGAPNQTDFRVNTDTGMIEYYAGAAWNVVDINKSPRGYKFGMTLLNNVASPTTDINIGAGSCRSADDTITITLANAIRKNLSLPFAQGSGQGMRSSAALADGTWHIFAIPKADGTADVFAHNTTNPAAVLPAGFTGYRRIGSIIREAGAIVAFTQRGNEFRWRTPSQDFNTSPSSTAGALRALSVPLGIQVLANVTYSAQFATGDTHPLTLYSIINSPDDTDNAASASNFSICIYATNDSGNDTVRFADSAVVLVRTNTSGQVRTRLSDNNAGWNITGVTHGWFDYFED